MGNCLVEQKKAPDYNKFRKSKTIRGGTFMSKDYSLWAEAKTKHGLMADEVISGLQKSIRRSMTDWHVAMRMNYTRQALFYWKNYGVV